MAFIGQYILGILVGDAGREDMGAPYISHRLRGTEHTGTVSMKNSITMSLRAWRTEASSLPHKLVKSICPQPQMWN